MTGFSPFDPPVGAPENTITSKPIYYEITRQVMGKTFLFHLNIIYSLGVIAKIT